ncbi:hypothetical protein O181_012270 [Austropuccinia psidii MF-1]|uniref:Uncharacterized protein n=1 Tax=Austropuccinia psidii MF-1 TaxID=1389203 RepID=A0A9Q3GMR9_9BASI|nr:hypothetical protein [Austropuccinia psidii MF-1]
MLLVLPAPLSTTLLPYLGAPQTFMHCGPGGAFIENFQSNPTETLFVEGVLITDKNYHTSSQQPDLQLMLFTCYPNILFIIVSFRKQDFKLKIHEEYDSSSHSQCELFTPTFSASNFTPPFYPAVFSLSSKQKLIQLSSGSDLPKIKNPSSLIKKPD